MVIKYRYSESTVKPDEIMYGATTVFLRRNITPTIRMNDEGNEYTVWTYEEAKMSYEEFKEYSDKLAVQNNINISDVPNKLAKVLEGQSIGDDNQLIIMEAIADLYELIANLS